MTFTKDSIMNDNTNKSKYMKNILWASHSMIDYITSLLDTHNLSDFENDGVLSIEEIKTYTQIGTVEINKHLRMKMEGKLHYMYLITDPSFKTLYISIGVCHPFFWHKFSNKKKFIESFDTLHESYNPEEFIIKYEKEVRAFIGSTELLKINMRDIENHFILNPYNDGLIWGSLWKIHPFRDEYMTKDITYQNSIIYTGQAMRQTEDTETVSVLTNYSKSEIRIENLEGNYIINIKYNPVNIENRQIKTINNKFVRNYQDDMPIDIINSIVNFPYITDTVILNIKPLTEYNFIIVTLVANNYSRQLALQDQFVAISNDSDVTAEVKNIAVECLNNIKICQLIENVEKDYDIYKRIEEEMKKNSDYRVDNIKNIVMDEISTKYDDKIKSVSGSMKIIGGYVENVIDSVKNILDN